MKINQVAKLTGVTVRTLHYYDEIGLLKPDHISEKGYRLYSRHNLDTLQQILFFRELNFSLNEIKSIITNPGYNKIEALQKQKELLQKQQHRLGNLINLIDGTIKGEKNMSFKEFDMSEIESTKQKYAAEVKERWGNSSAYAESEAKTARYGPQEWEKINAEANAIMEGFAQCKHLNPDSKEAQALVEKWQAHISDNFYHCTKDILAGLGQMYISDERFTTNIDKLGQGTAAFMSEAIKIYCQA